MRLLDKRGWALIAALGVAAIAAVVLATAGGNGDSHAHGGERMLAAHGTPTAAPGAKTAAGTSSPAPTAAKADAPARAHAIRQAERATGAGSTAGSGSTVGGGSESDPPAHAVTSLSTRGHGPATRGHGPATRGHGSSLPPAKPATARSAGGGGLSIAPGIFEHTAQRGSLGSIEISNTTSAPMTVQVALRPWLQSRGGEVSPNRGGVLAGVRVSASTFTLAAEHMQPLEVTLTSTPPQRSLYGAIEVTGSPPGHTGAGVKLAYRLVSSLRLDAPQGAQTFNAKAGRLIEQGSVKHGALLLAVRNTGNTIAPIGGTVRLSGEGVSLSADAIAKAIVPGQTVDVPLTPLSGSLPRGRYSVSVILTQSGRRLGAVKRTIYLR